MRTVVFIVLALVLLATAQACWYPQHSKGKSLSYRDWLKLRGFTNANHKFCLSDRSRIIDMRVYATKLKDRLTEMSNKLRGLFRNKPVKYEIFERKLGK